MKIIKPGGIAITPIAGYTGSPCHWYRLKGTENLSSKQDFSPLVDNKIESAVKIACQQVGKAYVSGGVGPNVFDCSGLVYYAYRQAGFPINHRCTTYTMEAQQSPFKRISRHEVRRGDLILYPGHVGIYLGPSLSSPNSLVHAALPGLGIIYQRANSMSITGLLS